VASRCAGQTTIVAATTDALRPFPLERYDAYIAATAARDASLLHVCTGDQRLTARFVGVTDEADPALVLVRRCAPGQTRAAISRPRRYTFKIPIPPQSPTAHSSPL
jgi:hypothetical protein